MEVEGGKEIHRLALHMPLFECRTATHAEGRYWSILFHSKRTSQLQQSLQKANHNLRFPMIVKKPKKVSCPRFSIPLGIFPPPSLPSPHPGLVKNRPIGDIASHNIVIPYLEGIQASANPFPENQKTPPDNWCKLQPVLIIQLLSPIHKNAG